MFPSGPGWGAWLGETTGTGPGGTTMMTRSSSLLGSSRHGPSTGGGCGVRGGERWRGGFVWPGAWPTGWVRLAAVLHEAPGFVRSGSARSSWVRLGWPPAAQLGGEGPGFVPSDGPPWGPGPSGRGASDAVGFVFSTGLAVLGFVRPSRVGRVVGWFGPIGSARSRGVEPWSACRLAPRWSRLALCGPGPGG
jgi:hypothetical protein